MLDFIKFIFYTMYVHYGGNTDICKIITRRAFSPI